MKNIIILLFVIAAIAAFFHLSPQSDAQNTTNRNRENLERNQLTEKNVTPPVFLKTAENQKNAAFDELIGKANESGAVRVIVGLRIENFTPDNQLSARASEQQREAIREAQNNLLEKLKTHQVSDVKQFRFIPFTAMKSDADALASMKNLPEVISIEEDQINAPTLIESVPLVGAPQAWQAGFSGQGQTVAVIDSGIDKNHPFLAGKVVSEACYATNNGANISSLCPNGVTETTAPDSGLDCSMTINGCGHGTHVAGIAAGRDMANNRFGVAKDATLIALNVGSRFNNQTDCGQTPAPCVRYFDSDIIKALERVYTLRNTFNIASVNMSLGGGSFTVNCESARLAYKVAIDSLRSVGIATVISSGNNSFINATGSPGCLSNAVIVGSSDDGSNGTTADVVSNFSNSAFHLNLLAPGRWINSSLPNNSYANYSGTSMAAPHVAGAFAVLKQRSPNASVSQILNNLAFTGQPITDTRNNLIKPRIKIDAALQSLNNGGVNVSCGQVTPLQNATPINGNLSTSDCQLLPNRYADFYSFNGVQGQFVSISMTSTAVDSYLALVNPNGDIIHQDNNSGGSGNNAFISGAIPKSGIYYIVAVGATAGQTGNYTISRIGGSSGNACDVVLPVNIGQTINGTLATTDCVSNSFYYNYYYFTGRQGQKVAISMNSAQVDSWLILWRALPWGEYQQLAFDNNGGGGTNARIPAGNGNFTLPETGVYAIGATTNISNTTGNYTLSLTQPTQTRFDFDGDGRADISVFRPSTGGWFISNSSNGAFVGTQFGVNGDMPSPADFDGDGKTDISVFRPSVGGWYRLNSSNNSFVATQFGANGDLPVAGDFDADGKADIAVFRPSDGAWYRLNSSNGQFVAQQFGANGDKPQVGDFDGDGKSDLAVFRPSTGAWYLLRSSDNAFFGIGFGQNGDIPTTADFDGDGRSDIAVYRPPVGGWYRLNSSNGQFVAQQFGIAEDKPVAADYDGDGRADIAVFRPSNGTWYLNRSTAQFTAVQFGANGDTPTPAAFGQ